MKQNTSFPQREGRGFAGSGSRPGNILSRNNKPTAQGKSASTTQASGAVSSGTEDLTFKSAESQIIHEALRLAGFEWFDGERSILGKKNQMEVVFRPGRSQEYRWAVMAFPLYDMNLPNSAEICLHFLTEAHAMAHMLDFQYQVAINMETEQLEFLIQLPVDGVTGSQLGELISSFFSALQQTVEEDLSEIMAYFAENPA